jgi:aminopeptidase YwaD
MPFCSKFSPIKELGPRSHRNRSSSQFVVVRTHRLRIDRNLQALVGERHPGTSPGALRKAAHYLATQFAKSGWSTSDQFVRAWGKTYRNVVAIRYPGKVSQGGELPPLLIGAHYDTVSGSPGADDNASGLVVLLELAFRLRVQPLARPILLVAFCLEEQDRLGSQAFAARLKVEHRELTGAIILECVGFAKSEAGTQKAPPAVPIAVPNQGDFLAIVGNETSRSLVVQLEQEARRQASQLKTLSLVVPDRGEAMPHTRRSDHASFWDAGYPAVMLTDTANFRNPHYHRETDTVATLNLEFLSDVATMVTTTVMQIAGVPP